MYEKRLNEISRKLALMRELDPEGRILSGAEIHRYEMNPPASRELVEAWEWQNGITLPDELREFLMVVGNGGAGPYYKLWKLALYEDEEVAMARAYRIPHFGEGHPWFESMHPAPFSANPEHWANNMDGEMHDWSIFKDSEEDAVFIGTEGCDEDILVVLSGECRGEVWSVWEDFFGFTYYSRPAAHEKLIEGIPFGHKGTERLRFLEWYEYWLETGVEWAKAAKLSSSR